MRGNRRASPHFQLLRYIDAEKKKRIEEKKEVWGELFAKYNVLNNAANTAVNNMKKQLTIFPTKMQKTFLSSNLKHEDLIFLNKKRKLASDKVEPRTKRRKSIVNTHTTMAEEEVGSSGSDSGFNSSSKDEDDIHFLSASILSEDEPLESKTKVVMKFLSQPGQKASLQQKAVIELVEAKYKGCLKDVLKTALEFEKRMHYGEEIDDKLIRKSHRSIEKESEKITDLFTPEIAKQYVTAMFLYLSKILLDE